MDRWKDPQDEKIFGLEAWQFDLAFFLVIGVIAVWLFLFGGAHALGILGNDETPSAQVAAVGAVAPVASSVVQAPNREEGDAPVAAPAPTQAAASAPQPSEEQEPTPPPPEPTQTPPPPPPPEPTSTPPPPPPPPEPTPTPEANCHPSYPTVCIPPPPPDLNCGDIPYTDIEVRHDVADPDPHGFDGNKDGVGCQS